jgi:hypothetical protein
VVRRLSDWLEEHPASMQIRLHMDVIMVTAACKSVSLILYTSTSVMSIVDQMLAVTWHACVDG